MEDVFMFLYPATTFFLLFCAGLLSPVKLPLIVALISGVTSIICLRNARYSDLCSMFAVWTLGAAVPQSISFPLYTGAYKTAEPMLVHLHEVVKSQNEHLHFSAVIVKGNHLERKKVYLRLFQVDSCLSPEPGDLLMGKFALHTALPPLVPETFDRQKWFKSKGWSAQLDASAPYTKRIGAYPLPRLLRWRLSLKNALERSSLSVSTKSFIAAITLGDKSGITHQTTQAFSRAGLSHILALSGLHAGLVFLIFLKCLSWIPRSFPYSNLLKFIIPCALLWMYVVITGAGASVLRAALMCTLVQLTRLMGKQGGGIEGLHLAATLILCFKPGLVNDLGFQFSYLAVAGILGIKPPPGMLKTHKWLRYPIQSLWISFTAQLLTTPAGLYHFGIFPVYFFLSNLVCVPLASILVTLSVFLYPATLFNLPSAWLEQVIEFCAYLLFLAVEYYESLPVATLENTYLPPITALGCTLLFLGFSILKINKTWLIPGLLFLLLLFRIENQSNQGKSELLIGSGFAELRVGKSAYSIGQLPYHHTSTDAKRGIRHRRQGPTSGRISAPSLSCELLLMPGIIVKQNSGRPASKQPVAQIIFNGNTLHEFYEREKLAFYFNLSKSGLNSLPLLQREP